ncbi:hypothetical protein E3N88_31295 [Mikania micrantha]|uniref:Defective in cullin neddylation protein n=1 Tax=Mikania micrantha TaxID=192012 RepID=A0A5N6MP06_9ASTR|nr:hypothetical protein E3N88_31295 [Mikania micrantha]
MGNKNQETNVLGAPEAIRYGDGQLDMMTNRECWNPNFRKPKRIREQLQESTKLTHVKRLYWRTLLCIWEQVVATHIDLLTFDECHYAQVESNHPFAEIMKIFYKSDVAKHTCIFGMTASPIFGRGASISSLETLMLSPEGVEKLCSDLSVEHTDARVLMLAWKMNAKKQGYFTQDEWRTGLTSLHADTLKKLKKQLSHLQKQVSPGGNETCSKVFNLYDHGQSGHFILYR